MAGAGLKQAEMPRPQALSNCAVNAPAPCRTRAVCAVCVASRMLPRWGGRRAYATEACQRVQNRPMDDIVRQALIKWPHVPHCYGWLGLDARGRWYLRDDAVQALGAFPQSKGVLLEHAKLLAFIERNYEADAQGQWFFQNGPQRVYVELECTPWIWRIGPELELHSHTGRAAVADAVCLLDDEGRVYLTSDVGLGLVHTLDVPQVADAIECGKWTVQAVCADDLPTRYSFVPSPARANGNTAA